MWGEDTGFFVHEDAWGGMAVRAGFRSRGRKHWVFAHEDAQVGGEAQLCGHATRGSAPSAALGALRTEPPLRVTASAAASLPRAYYPGNYRVIPTPLRTHDICHVQVMTLCTAAARKPAV